MYKKIIICIAIALFSPVIYKRTFSNNFLSPTYWIIIIILLIAIYNKSKIIYLRKHRSKLVDELIIWITTSQLYSLLLVSASNHSSNHIQDIFIDQWLFLATYLIALVLSLPNDEQ